MKTQIVKEYMVPLSEYATVSKDATLWDAVLALEKALAAFDPGRHRHRAILVFDESERIVGKISQIDILRALEPDYDKIVKDDQFTRLGLSPMYQRSQLEQYKLWSKPLNDLCHKAARFKVESFMQTTTDGEFINEETSLNEAIHQLIMGKHQSLLVTKDGKIVGILRLTDVFTEIVATIKECKR